jgi:hypothetical protein
VPAGQQRKNSVRTAEKLYAQRRKIICGQKKNFVRIKEKFLALKKNCERTAQKHHTHQCESKTGRAYGKTFRKPGESFVKFSVACEEAEKSERSKICNPKKVRTSQFC